jgi:proline iminopeptidase
MNRRDFVRLASATVAASSLPLELAARSDEPGGPRPLTADVKTGGCRMIPIMGGKYHVWTKRVGNSPIKVLTLHGGPGVNHEYFEVFEDFLPQAGIEFYHYDQLGSLNSDNPSDDSLWTVERFTDEVEDVRRGLGLENFILLGHSWGGMLGIEYALKYGKHLRGVVISNMTASIGAYMKHAADLRNAFPADVVKKMDDFEKAGKYDDPAYQDIMLNLVYKRHLCRLDPWPEPFDRAFRHLNQRVYNVMQGPNEFVVTGNFKDWDRWADLPKINVPTLVMAGKYDTMSVDDLTRMSKLLPKGKLSVCANGSHLAMYDDQQKYFGDLIPFLKSLA